MQVKRLDFAERWLRDGIDSCRAPAFFLNLDVDMSKPQQLIGLARARSIRITYVHILLRAAALALSANPDLNRMICGRHAYHSDDVDIALSIGGEAIAAPLLVIEGANRKELPEIASEVTRRISEVREQDSRMLALLRRWGWLVPTSILRRAVLRALMRQAGFRRKGSAVFQMTVLTEVDSLTTSVFGASALLAAGAVQDRVVAVDGHSVVRPMITLSCCADHRVWNGQDGQKFLTSMKGFLESDVLMREPGKERLVRRASNQS